MDILGLIKKPDLLEFSQNLSIKRNYLGDRLFPDIKTQNLEAEYYRLTDGLNLPTMATVHGFDTEAAIGERDTFEKVVIEKLLIKEKINQTERVQIYLKNGVTETSSIIDYLFDDMGRLAETIKTRTEVAKMEAISKGAITVKENNLDFTISYEVPNTNKKSYDWSNPDHDILADIQEMIDTAKSQGKILNKAITSTKIVRLMQKNKHIQSCINSALGVGTFVTVGQLNSLMDAMFGFTIETNDNLYKYKNAKGKKITKRFFDEDTFTLLSLSPSGNFGTGLWGVTPEEADYGQYTQKSSSQFITLTHWSTPDPVAVWTKASGLFIPVMPDPYGIVIGNITTK